MEPRCRRTLVITDNVAIHDALQALLVESGLQDVVSVGCSPQGPARLRQQLPIVDLKTAAPAIAEQFELILSAHCKQLFPDALHRRRECINIHPGHNPETRGWYPQVWAILHGLPLGFTVHRIDEQLDHGGIIHRESLPLHAWDTSYTAYQRVLAAEIDWLRQNLQRLLQGDYAAEPMSSAGTLYRKRDFDALLEIDLQQTGTWRDFIDHLRAVSFPGYRNAWFIDPGSGQKIHLSIQLDPDPDTTPIES